MIRFLGLVIVTSKRFSAMEDHIERLKSVAESNSERIVSLKKKYDTLKAERNKTVRELIQENKKLSEQLNKNNVDHNEGD